MEDRLQVESRALLRRLLQDHLDLRAVRESRVTVIGADGAPRGRVETGHTRGLATVFGPVKVGRIAYRTPGRPNLHPGDGLLNLPVARHSHGLRRLAAIESARGSFEAAAQAIGRVTGQQLGKRQVEDLARRAAVDFDAFYATRKPPAAETGDLSPSGCAPSRCPGRCAAPAASGCGWPSATSPPGWSATAGGCTCGLPPSTRTWRPSPRRCGASTRCPASADRYPDTLCGTHR